MGKKNDNTLVKNASFLMVAALISKIIGMLYKSPLSTTLGSQSFALFQFAQNVYFILLMIASFSIPQAVSKIMAEKIAFHRYKDAQKVFYGALIYAAVAGGIVALICVFGAGILVPDSMANARLALQMLAPTIFMSGLCGVFRPDSKRVQPGYADQCKQKHGCFVKDCFYACCTRRAATMTSLYTIAVHKTSDSRFVVPISESCFASGFWKKPI